MKQIRILTLFLALMLLVTACAATDFAAADSAPPSEAADENSWWEAAPEAEAPAVGSFVRERLTAEETDAVTAPAETGRVTADRIIYEAHASIQTEDFDATIRQVYALIAQHRGFIARSNIAGPGQRALTDVRFFGRWAEFSLRVPSQSYSAMTDALDTLGYLNNLSTTATNVSAQYADLSSRLASLRVQEERILAMLERADTLQDLLELEARLGDLIFQIERLTSQRNDLEQQVAYSTIHLHITEVEEIVPLVDEPHTAGTVFSASLRVMGSFGRRVGLALVAIAPWLIALAALALPVVVILIFCHRRRRRKNVAE